MDIIEQARYGVFVGTVLLLALLVICSLLRSVRGPRTADRIIAVNMAGTMIISIIAVLSVMLDQNYLVDICLIYAMISFLGVVVLCKIYTGVYLQKKKRMATLEAIDENIRLQNRDSQKDEMVPVQNRNSQEDEILRVQGQGSREDEPVPVRNQNRRGSEKRKKRERGKRNGG